MNRDEALSLLAKARENGDTEAAHGDADQVLCDLLTSLGYEDVVSAWRAVNKWYA